MLKNYPWQGEALARSVLKIFLMADASSSMNGDKIKTLNKAIPAALKEVAKISQENPDAIIKIATLIFASDVHWMYEKPIEAENFKWQDITSSGSTAFGAACLEINGKLSRSNGWMAEPNGSLAPVIIVLSDGQPTDEFKQRLETLKGNKWFKVACKIAIAIGDDADKDVLAEFTGNMETVITVHDVNQLSKMIKAVIVTSSMINSKSSGVGAIGSTGGTSTSAIDPAQSVIGTIKSGTSSDPALKGVDFGNSTDNAGTDSWSF